MDDNESLDEQSGALRPQQVAALTGNARDFVDDPVTFARLLGVPLESFSSGRLKFIGHFSEPRDLQRRSKATASISAESPLAIRERVVTAFGDAFEAYFVPFGLQFRGRAKIDASSGITGTGTASVTWADTDTGVDG